jgi:predicted TIM-barrel fold metal-dependent hydrolase
VLDEVRAAPITQLRWPILAKAGKLLGSATLVVSIRLSAPRLPLPPQFELSFGRGPAFCQPHPMISRRNLIKLAAAGALGSATASDRASAQTAVGGEGPASPSSVNQTKLKIIALEEHYCPPEVFAAWGQLTPEIKGGILFHQKPMAEMLEDLAEKRLARMDAMGVDVQVLSLTTPGVQVCDRATAIALARSSNDAGARAVAAHPDRFQCFATLPTTAPAAQSVAELKRCVEELGFKGWLVNGRSLERSLDHPDFFPVFAAAAKLRVPVYLHPQIPPKAVRDAYYSDPRFGGPLAESMLAGPGFGWHVEAGLQAVRLILSGMLDRLPELQIILGHWGETVIPYMDRIELATRGRPEKLARKIPDYFRSNFHVTPSGMFTGGFLPQAIELMGVDRIMFSADDPFVTLPPGGARRFITEAPLSEIEKAKIAHGNWERLTKRS